MEDLGGRSPIYTSLAPLANEIEYQARFSIVSRLFAFSSEFVNCLRSAIPVV
jgi:hypothetical protein